jgi:hypothetical protein
MNYQSHYDRLMARAKSRILHGYSERHHVQPKCLGGSDDDSNIVRLTAEEHYVAHLLLVKIYPHSEGLLWASFMMTGGNKNQGERHNNKIYGWQRRKFAESVSKRMTGKPLSAHGKMRVSESNKLRVGMKYKKSGKSSPLKGIPKSDAHRRALSLAKQGKKRGPHSLLHRQRLSESIKAALKRKREQSLIQGANHV